MMTKCEWCAMETGALIRGRWCSAHCMDLAELNGEMDGLKAAIRRYLANDGSQGLYNATEMLAARDALAELLGLEVR